jgi:hypothetical protein
VLIATLALRTKAAFVAISIEVRILCVLLLFSGLAGVALAQSIPLPRPRPPEISTAPAEAAPGVQEAAKTEKKPDDPPPPSACFVRLKELAVIRAMPPVGKPGGCFANDVVQLEAVILPDKRQVAIEPAGTFRCEMAQALTDWIRDELAPATAAQLGSALRAVENFDSYSCRGRNRVAGALLSEHGKANALDIRSLKLVNGTAAQPTDANVSKDFRDGMRKSACARFTTVLGPGSDGYHEDHIHVDLAQRRNDYRLCQWEMRQPIHRAMPSPHVASYGKPTPHVAPLSLPPATTATANVEEKPRRAAAPRRL